MEREELARRLLATFAAEITEQVQVMNADLLALEQRPDDADRLQSVFRVAHSLKGAARAAGVPLVEQVCHALESQLSEVRRGKRALTDRDFAAFFSSVDALTEAAGLLRTGGDVADSRLVDALRTLTGRAAGAPRTERAPRPAEPPQADHVRVDAARLDALLAATGELLIERARVAHGREEARSVADDVARFAARWRTTGRALRVAAERARAGPGPQRALRELQDELQRLLRRTDRLAGLVARGAHSVEVAVDRIAERALALRMRPFGEAAEPLARTVRDLAKASGKEVRFELSGAEVRADRAVLDALRDALLQLVRNAVDHGIETPVERLRQGKPGEGAVRVGASLAGDRIVVTVADDGAGLDTTSIRNALAARGITPPADDAALGDALMNAGISTAAETGPISGRGVGLDIVRQAVDRMQGEIDVAWQPGAGTTFTIRCRPSLATMRAVLMRVGSHVLAVPVTNIVRLMRLSADEIRQIQGRQTVITDAGPVPLVSLARILGPPLMEQPASGVVPVVVLSLGQRRLAVAVDELLAEQELVSRPVPNGDFATRFVSGATLLGTARIAPILNVGPVVAAGLEAMAGGVALAEREPELQRKSILVVDDSITTRSLEQSVLEAAGFAVVTAVDGADAWRLLQERGADLVVSDVDMPRMDGFELCRAIRSSKRLVNLPVILVTALESPEDRKRGMDVGADAYIGKSGFDQAQLLETVRQLLGGTA